MQVTTYFDYGSQLLSHPSTKSLTFISLTPAASQYPNADLEHVVGTPYLTHTHWNQYSSAEAERAEKDAELGSSKTIFSMASFSLREAGFEDRVIVKRCAHVRLDIFETASIQGCIHLLPNPPPPLPNAPQHRGRREPLSLAVSLSLSPFLPHSLSFSSLAHHFKGCMIRIVLKHVSGDYLGTQVCCCAQ